VEIDVHFTSLFTVTKSHKEELDTVLFIFEVGIRWNILIVELTPGSCQIVCVHA